MPPRTKQAAIVLLAIVNAVLLCVLLARTVGLPAAFGQTAAGGADKFLVVTGEAQSGYDAAYVLDSSARRLYVFTPNRNLSQFGLELRDMRDLANDFQRQATPVVPRR